MHGLSNMNSPDQVWLVCNHCREPILPVIITYYGTPYFRHKLDILVAYGLYLTPSKAKKIDFLSSLEYGLIQDLDLLFLLISHLYTTSSLDSLSAMVSCTVLLLSLTVHLQRNRKVYRLMKISYNSNYWQHETYTLNIQLIYGTNGTPEFMNQDFTPPNYLKLILHALKKNFSLCRPSGYSTQERKFSKKGQNYMHMTYNWLIFFFPFSSNLVMYTPVLLVVNFAI